MTWIALHEPDGDLVYVRSETIGRIRKETGKTIIDLAVGPQAIKETPTEVLAILKKYGD